LNCLVMTHEVIDVWHI